MIKRRELLRAGAAAALSTPALLLPFRARAQAPQAFYFDAVNGNDNAAGTTPSTAWKGIAVGRRMVDLFNGLTGSSNVAVHIARGSVYDGLGNYNNTFTAQEITGLSVQAYGDPGLPAPVFELRDSAARLALPWVRIGSSSVWRMTLPAPQEIHRVWLAGTEVEDLPARVITASRPGLTEPDPMLLPTEAEIAAALTGQTSVSYDGDLWDTFWYWGKSVETAHPSDPLVGYCLYLYSPDPAHDPSQHWGAGAIRFIRGGYGYGPVFAGCTDVQVSDIEVRGAHWRAFAIIGGSGLYDRIAARYNSYYTNTIQITDKFSGTVSYPGADVELRDILSSADLVNSKFFFDKDGIDANYVAGTHLRRVGNDMITIFGKVGRVKLAGGTVLDAIHGGVTVDYLAIDSSLTLAIDGTTFDHSNVRYGRALGFGSNPHPASSIDVRNISVTGQPTQSQIGLENIHFYNCHFSAGRSSVGHARTKYSRTLRNLNGTASYLSICNLSNLTSDHISIKDCEFLDCRNAPAAYDNYGTTSGARIGDDIDWINCTFVNIPEQDDLMVAANSNPNGPPFKIQMHGCRSYGYARIRYWYGYTVDGKPPHFRYANVGSGTTVTADQTVSLYDHTVLAQPPA